MENQIALVQSKHHLTYDEMKRAAIAIFDEATNEELIISFLTALAEKGETATEIAALVDVMTKQAIQLPILEAVDYIDNCGTGGDGLQSFNISTASAFVLAAAGLKVAKHGNRKVSSASGSADILEELGLPNNLTPKQLSESLTKENLAFIFAPTVHPKLKRIGQIRAQIGKPTIFNLVGPLANPVPLSYQLTGINRPDFVVEYAEVMKKLGRKRALIISGEDGMDEASLYGQTTCTLLDQNELISFTITAEEVGLQSYPKEAIRGGTPSENARILREIFQGQRNAYFEAVAFNAGLALYTANHATTIQQGVKMAVDILLSGKAYDKLVAMIHYNEQLEVAQ
ncbi:MAG: anthranilate phosphoribosyltransferase [Kurthia sp.]|nr:anthranilate phosphoribosyltransferase [Candidatus Kurthia equi]